MRHIKATVGLAGEWNTSTFTSPNYLAVTYADLNKAFNATSVLQNIKLRWIAFYVLNVDASNGGVLRGEVANCYLQDAIESSNSTVYEDQGTTGNPPRVLIRIPPNQQVSRKGTDTTNLAYFAYLMTTVVTGNKFNYCLRAGITGRV